VKLSEIMKCKLDTVVQQSTVSYKNQDYPITFLPLTGKEVLDINVISTGGSVNSSEFIRCLYDHLCDDDSSQVLDRPAIDIFVDTNPDLALVTAIKIYTESKERLEKVNKGLIEAKKNLPTISP